MNLNKLRQYIKRYIFLILGAIVLLFLLTTLFNNKKPFVFNFNKRSNYQEISANTQNYPKLKYSKKYIGNYIFYININNGVIEYFKYNKGTFLSKGYYINNAQKFNKYINNAIYLGYFSSFSIFNVPVPPLGEGNLNYETFLMNHFNSIPSYLMPKDTYTYIENHLSLFYASVPNLYNVSIEKYSKTFYYIIYTYHSYDLLGQAGEKYFVQNVGVTLIKKSNKWEISNIQIL